MYSFKLESEKLHDFSILEIGGQIDACLDLVQSRGLDTSRSEMAAFCLDRLQKRHLKCQSLQVRFCDQLILKTFDQLSTGVLYVLFMKPV